MAGITELVAILGANLQLVKQMTRHLEFEDPNFTFNDEKDLKKKSLFTTVFETIISIFPQANPDFDDIYQNVKYWLVEFEEDGQPWREVGLNERREPITIGPYRNNRGFWTDSNLKQDQIDNCFFKKSTISESEFQNYWDSFLAD